MATLFTRIIEGEIPSYRVNISLSIDGHKVDVRMVDLKSEDEDSDLAALRHRLDLTSNLLSEDHHAPEQVILDIEDVVDLLTRYDERVTGLYGIDVEEGVELSVLGDSIRRDLPLMMRVKSVAMEQNEIRSRY